VYNKSSAGNASIPITVEFCVYLTVLSKKLWWELFGKYRKLCMGISKNSFLTRRTQRVAEGYFFVTYSIINHYKRFSK
jgi:hypothetical protein